MSLQEYLTNCRVDKIEDDEEFCQEEYELIREYCSNNRLTEDDIEEITARGYDRDDFPQGCLST